MDTDASLRTAKEIAEAIPLPSADFVKRLARQRKIPCTRLGHRSLFFNEAKVRAALEKFEVKAVA